MKSEEFHSFLNKEPKKAKKYYNDFMYNNSNEYNCDNCPANESDEYQIRDGQLPCRQYNCWVTCSCN